MNATTTTTSGIAGFCITPVAQGKIKTGTVVKNNGKTIPMKQDFFTITTLARSPKKDNESIAHPVEESLKTASSKPSEKLRAIPVRIMFNQTANSLQVSYSAFDSQSGRPACQGNGLQAKRRNLQGEISEIPCPGSAHCKDVRSGAYRCKQFARLIVAIDHDGMWEKDPLIGFTYRTSSFNTIRALSARLEEYEALMGGKMAGFPATLRVRSKASAASFNQPFYWLDLEPRESLISSARSAFEYQKQMAEVGLDLEKLEAAVASGYSRSEFAFLTEIDEDADEIADTFFAEEEAESEQPTAESTPTQEAVTLTQPQAEPEPAKTFASPELVSQANHLVETYSALTGTPAQSIIASIGTWLHQPDVPFAELPDDSLSQAIASLLRQIAKAEKQAA